MKTGLILIDIQNDYFSGGKMELVGIDAAAAKSAQLLDVFRAKSLPTFHIQHVFAGEDPPFFAPDTEGVKLNDAITPREGELIVTKHYPNSFRDSGLEEEIREAGVERVLICGAMSHMCVDATTRAAADMGFTCAVAHDACATRDLDFEGRAIPADHVHGSYMSALGWGYAEVAATAKLIEDL